MKRLFGYALMLALTAAPAFAAKNSQSLNFASPVKVGATEIPAGDCKVTWTGTGDNVQVTIAENGKTLTIPAKLVAEKHPTRDTSSAARADLISCRRSSSAKSACSSKARPLPAGKIAAPTESQNQA